MERAWYWRLCWGPDQCYVVSIGVLVGISVATFARPPDGDSMGWIVVHFVVSAVAGLVVFWLLYRYDRVPPRHGLSSGDRALVVRSVARGRAPDDSRLAPAAADVAAHILRHRNEPDDAGPREQRDRRLAGWITGTTVVIRVISITVDGHVLSTATLCGSVLVLFLLFRRVGGLQEEIRGNAVLAQTAARAVTATHDESSSPR